MIVRYNGGVRGDVGIIGAVREFVHGARREFGIKRSAGRQNPEGTPAGILVGVPVGC